MWVTADSPVIFHLIVHKDTFRLRHEERRLLQHRAFEAIRLHRLDARNGRVAPRLVLKEGGDRFVVSDHGEQYVQVRFEAVTAKDLRRGVGENMDGVEEHLALLDTGSGVVASSGAEGGHAGLHGLDPVHAPFVEAGHG